MSNVDLAIVVVAYNRVESLNRLLGSLAQVDYEEDIVPLIISIDYSGEDAVYEQARQFEWRHGPKRIIMHERNLGLRNHVLSCGDLVEDFDAIIVLEDDLVVSGSMYSYARRAVKAYRSDPNVESISLYGKAWSETAYLPFIPALSKYETYFAQTAESWGQIWFKDNWKKFRAWYEDNSSNSFDSAGIPRNVREWDSKSWKKFHIKYCIEKDKHTVYPYQSFTTCLGDVGEHTGSSTFVSQVPLAPDGLKQFDFAPFESADSVKYDAFLERVLPGFEDVCFDLYGWKTDFAEYKYLISSNILSYRVVESYGLSFRPHEENIIRRVPGTDFFKYDLSIKSKNDNRQNRERLLEYYNLCNFDRALSRMLIPEMANGARVRVVSRVKKMIKRKLGKSQTSKG